MTHRGESARFASTLGGLFDSASVGNRNVISIMSDDRKTDDAGNHERKLDIPYTEALDVKTCRPTGAIVSMLPTGEIALNFYVDAIMVGSETLYLGEPDDEGRSETTKREIQTRLTREVVARTILDSEVAASLCELIGERIRGYTISVEKKSLEKDGKGKS